MRPEGALLALDTAGAHCAAVLAAGGRVLAARHEAMERGQAERLIPLCTELLAEAGATWADLAGIGVGTGPGNFTGVRIAVAAARGIALARGLSAAGVSRFEAAAEGRAGRWLVLLPGRAGMVCAQVVQNGMGEGHAIEIAPAAGLPEGFAAGCGGVLDVAGAPLPVLPQLPQVAGAAVVSPLSALAVDEPDPAPAIARIAARRIAAANGAGRVGPRPAPLYVRPPDAAPPAVPPPRLLP